MTNREFYKNLNNALESVREEDYVGVRFADRKLSVGDECELSRHNTERDDERDFPEFGTDEYEEMEQLDGSSAWGVVNPWMATAEEIDGLWYDKNDLDKNVSFYGEHCYLIVGDGEDTPHDADFGEIVIENARVAAVIY